VLGMRNGGSKDLEQQKIIKFWTIQKPIEKITCESSTSPETSCLRPSEVLRGCHTAGERLQKNCSPP